MEQEELHIKPHKPLDKIGVYMTNTTRFERAIVRFTPGLSVDGYKMPDGEFRVGTAGASRLVGFSDNWLSRLTSRGGKTLKALQGMGFTGYQKEGSVARSDVSGASLVNTISLNDFCVLVTYAVQEKKIEAIALNIAFLQIPVTDFFRDAFGEKRLSIEEVRAKFCAAYSQTINWLQEDRYEIEELWLAGDPLEIQNWNSSIRWV